jgi:hypothetical protein
MTISKRLPLYCIVLSVGFIAGKWSSDRPLKDAVPTAPIVQTNKCPQWDEDGPTINIHGDCDSPDYKKETH